MSTTVSIGQSLHLDPLIACKEAAIQAKATLPQGTADFVFLLFTKNYCQKETPEILQRILQPEHLIGTQTTGIILSDQMITQGLALLAIDSKEIKFHTSLYQHKNALPAYSEGYHFSKTLTNQHQIQNRKATLLLSNSIHQNHEQFLQSLSTGLGVSLPIIGGCGGHFFYTHPLLQCHNNTITQESSLGVLLSQNIKLITESDHGFIPLGKPRLITSVQNNIIHTIDHKPAIDIYKDSFPSDFLNQHHLSIEDLFMSYPLGHRSTSNDNHYSLHRPIQILPSGSLVFQSEFPQNHQVNIMFGKDDLLKQSAQSLALRLKNQINNKNPLAFLIFASQIRNNILHSSSYEEIQIIKNTLSLTTPIFGMYTDGEILAKNNKPSYESAHLSITAMIQTI